MRCLVLWRATGRAGSRKRGACDSCKLYGMQNEEGKILELYLPRKYPPAAGAAGSTSCVLRRCSATNRLIPAKEHGSCNINVGQVRRARQAGRRAGVTRQGARGGREWPLHRRVLPLHPRGLCSKCSNCFKLEPNAICHLSCWRQRIGPTWGGVAVYFVRFTPIAGS